MSWEAIPAGLTFNGATANGVVTFGNSTTADVEANLTFDGTTLNVVGNAGVGIARTEGTLHVHTASAGSVTAETYADDLVVESNGIGGISILTPDANSANIAFGSPSDADNGRIEVAYASGAPSMRFSTGGTERMRIASAGLVYIGDAAASGSRSNANMTMGLTINQEANNDEILAFKSSTVAHGMIDFAQTDTYGLMKKVSGTDGGLYIGCFGEQEQALLMNCISTVGNTGKTTGTTGALDIRGALKDGNGATVLGTDANILVIRNNGLVRFIFDAEGSGHADVEWTTFSDSRLKKNVGPVPYGLAEVLQLRPKIYDKHSGDIVDGETVLEENSRRMIGFLAQDVKALMPELVKEVDTSNAFYSLNDGKLAAVIVKAIQELNAKMEN